MANTLPLRLYRLVFKTTHGPQELSFDRTAQRACAAKNMGFLSLELELSTRPDYPKRGWYLESIRELPQSAV